MSELVDYGLRLHRGEIIDPGFTDALHGAAGGRSLEAFDLEESESRAGRFPQP